MKVKARSPLLTPDDTAASKEDGTANIDPAVNRQEETDEYVSSLKLLLVMFSIKLAVFFLLLDAFVVSTASQDTLQYVYLIWEHSVTNTITGDSQNHWPVPFT